MIIGTIMAVFMLVVARHYIATDLRDINITKHVCDLYQRSNKVISDFNACDSVTLDALHQTYCMHMGGCELWNLNCTLCN